MKGYDRMNPRRRRLLAVGAAATAALALGPLASAKPVKTRIGIVGSGRVGGAIGAAWVKAGHEVMFSSRNIENDKALAAKLGPNARAGTPREAAAFGEVVMISVPYGSLPEVGKDLADLIKGKVVIDTCNPFVSRDGEIAKWARDKG
ncbi:MAG TPA: NAD(P)-binding domain-containing protein, partial [Usitatibacter sp.]|nr:NAD(P)-binding domain-containing protein [Usitatibacter sp.]